MMPHRLRVLFVIGTMGGGGAERQVLECLRNLDRLKFQPFLYLARRTGELLADVPADVPIDSFWDNFPRWQARFCWLTGSTRPVRWKHLARVLRDRRIDVIYDRTFLATLDAGPATWWRKTPRISAVVADPRIQLDLYFPRRQWLWRRFARRVYRTANIVLANSQGLRQRVIDYFDLPADHVRELPNMLDSARLDRLAATPQATGDANRSRFRILTVGRIDEHKGHRDLLEAVRILVQDRNRPQILWQIIGDGPNRVPLLEEVQRLKLGPHVEWLGVMTNPYPCYRAADVFCLPSLTEGSPNVLLEALALGTPVVSTDCPSGPREILEDGRWGALVPVQNPSALAEAIAGRMDHPQDWIIRAAQAKPVIRKRYATESGVRRLEELLIEAAGRCVRAAAERASSRGEKN